jgi:hypothetical protein
MNMPQFNAETSLGPSMNTYWGRAPYGTSASMQVTPSQIWRGLDIFPLMRCCGYVPSLGRFVCTSQRTFTLQNCECRRTPDGYPWILCHDPLLTLG